MHILGLLFNHSAEVLRLGRNGVDFGIDGTMLDEDHKELIGR